MHFTGLIAVDTAKAEIGLKESLDRILLPYCGDTSKAFEYAEFIDRTQVVLDSAKAEGTNDLDKIASEYGYEKVGDHQFGYYINPDERWDSYSIGGRWANMLINKNGVSCNACRISDLDFSAMREAFLAKEKARFEEGMQMLKAGDTEGFAPKHLYPGLCTIEDNTLYSCGNRVCSLGETFDEHAKNIGADSAEFFVPIFCCVDEDDWISKGEIGWFGMADNLSDAAVWANQVSDWIKEHIDGNWTLVVVDFHR